MKLLLLLGTVLSVVATACSSTLPAGVVEPVVSIRSVSGQMMPNRIMPEVDITLIANIHNPGDRAIEVRKMQFRSTGTGNLSLISEIRNVSTTIEPGESTDIELRTEATFFGPDPDSRQARIRGTLVFVADGESYRHVFTSSVN